MLGTAAHAAAGGPVPHPGVLASLAVLTAVVGVGFAGDRPGSVRALGVFAGSQVATHVLFVMGHPAHPQVGGPLVTTTALVATVVAIALMLAHADTGLAAVLPVLAVRPAPAVHRVSTSAQIDTDRIWQAVVRLRTCPRRGPPHLA